ncbi:RluA family pseudouridine synthase [candidate division KSB1 bacterium]|nr:RluA family pseudouridine synthase [candidate division KSB1 bacterium]
MQENNIELIVPGHHGKERLDVYLCGHLPSVTRAKIKKLIDDNDVTVNELPTKAGHIIRPGEIIKIKFPDTPKSTLEPEDIPLDIIYEDDYLLVVNKQPGMVVHPAYGNKTGTLVNALLAHCNRLSDVGGQTRPGLVHRLDKDTSGLLVIAKDDVTHVELAKQLSARKIEREYRAVVWKHLKEKEGRIEAALARHPKDRIKMTINPEGKQAVTHYKVLEELPLASYVKLNLETGRTHQIRVHMASLGHPVFSDSTYGGRGKQLAGMNTERTKFVTRLLKKFNRQMLHAKSIGFVHPALHKMMRFDSDIPGDMQELLETLRNSGV